MYAADLVTIAENKLIEKFTSWKEGMESKVNLNKTKVM